MKKKEREKKELGMGTRVKGIRRNKWSLRSSLLEAYNKGEHGDREEESITTIGAKSPPHIFQRLEDAKQKHALRQYEKAREEYWQAKEAVKQSCGKDDNELLMENFHLFRIRLENSEFLEQAKSMRDHHQGDQMWEMSLRDHWTVEPRIGDLYAKPLYFGKTDNKRRHSEQIGFPQKENSCLPLCKDASARETFSKSRWDSYEHFLKKFEKRLAKVSPHKPDFIGFEVIGSKKLPSQDSHTATKMDNKFEDLKPNLEEFSDQLQKEKAETSFRGICGPAAQLSSSSLFFPGKKGDLVMRNVFLENTGSTVLNFNWTRQLTAPPKPFFENLGDCFYLLAGSGRLIPGETKKFTFSFRSNRAGMFVQNWILNTSPSLPTPLKIMILTGLAYLEDPQRNERQKLNAELEKRQCRSAIEEVIAELIQETIKKSHWSAKSKPSYLSSSKHFSFLRSNLNLEPPAYYSPWVFSRLENISMIAASSTDIERAGNEEEGKNVASLWLWDASIETIKNQIDRINDVENQKNLCEMLSATTEDASVPKHSSFLLYTSMCKALERSLCLITNLCEQHSVKEVLDQNSDEEMMQIESEKDMEPPRIEKPLEIPKRKSLSSSSNEISQPNEGSTLDLNSEAGIVVASENCRQIEESRKALHQSVKSILEEASVSGFWYEVNKGRSALASVLEARIVKYLLQDDLESASWTTFCLERQNEENNDCSSN